MYRDWLVILITAFSTLRKVHGHSSYNQCSSSSQVIVPGFPVALSAVIPAGVSPSIHREQQFGRNGTEQNLHDIVLRRRAPADVVQHGASHAIADVDVDAGFLHEELHRGGVAATAGEVEEAFAVGVAGVEAVALRPELAQAINVAASHSLHHIHGVSVEAFVLEEAAVVVKIGTSTLWESLDGGRKRTKVAGRAQHCCSSCVLVCCLCEAGLSTGERKSERKESMLSCPGIVIYGFASWRWRRNRWHISNVVESV